jgi:hypothetical protein
MRGNGGLLKWSAFGAASLLGLVLAFMNWFAAGSDATSYLDLARNLAAGSWRENINGYWSPLLPAFVAMLFRFFHPSLAWELPVAEGAVYFSYVFALAASLFFHARLARLFEARFPATWSPAKATALFLFGFTAVFAAVFGMLGYGLTPDIFVVAFFLISGGFLARFIFQEATFASTVAFAFVLALGYLAKTIFFVLAVFFIFSFLASQWTRPRKLLATGLLALFFLVFSSVQWLPLSLAKGHFTFGDAGKINHIWYMAQGKYKVAEGLQTSLDGTPLEHPFQILSQDPLIYGFKGPVGGTFPNWYDPTYWMEGLHPAFRPLRQVAVIFLNGVLFVDALAGGSDAPTPGGGLGVTLSLVAFLALLAVGRSYRETIRLTPWPLLLPAVAGIALYGLAWVAYRHVVAYVLVLMIVGAGEAIARFDLEQLRVGRRISLALFAATFTAILGLTLNGLHAKFFDGGLSSFVHNPMIDAAGAFHFLGVPEGASIATVGDLANCYLPDAARVKVLARVQERESFWKLSEAERQRVYGIFSSAGIVAVLAEAPPPYEATPGWVPIGRSDYILYRLKPSSS